MSASSFHLRQHAIRLRAKAIVPEASISSRESQAVALTVEAEPMFVSVIMRMSSASEHSDATFLSLGRCVHTVASTEEEATAHACSKEGDEYTEKRSVRSSCEPRLISSGDADGPIRAVTEPSLVPSAASGMTGPFGTAIVAVGGAVVDFALATGGGIPTFA